MDVIYEQINNHQASFTKGLKKVAAHIGKDPKLFAMHSATDVGKHIGVSETTIIRFCHEIGYEGFSALQEKVRESLFRKNSFSDYLEAKIGNHTQDDSVKNTMRSDIDNIFNLIEYASDEDLEQSLSGPSNL